jgi:hypothetical protein
MVFKCFLGVFVSVSDVCFKCFICLQSILQVLHLDILKVDRVLHMLQCDLPVVVAGGGMRGRAGRRRRVGSGGPHNEAAWGRTVCRVQAWVSVQTFGR